jgi:hypothetical protein
MTIDLVRCADLHFARVLCVYVHTVMRYDAVYDVSSRESFEALPRWLEELENYVPPEVVKIVVGNKLDKVCVYLARSLAHFTSASHSIRF